MFWVCWIGYGFDLCCFDCFVVLCIFAKLSCCPVCFCDLSGFVISEFGYCVGLFVCVGYIVMISFVALDVFGWGVLICVYLLMGFHVSVACLGLECGVYVGVVVDRLRGLTVVFSFVRFCYFRFWLFCFDLVWLVADLAVLVDCLLIWVDTL